MMFTCFYMQFFLLTNVFCSQTDFSAQRDYFINEYRCESSYLNSLQTSYNLFLNENERIELELKTLLKAINDCNIRIVASNELINPDLICQAHIQEMSFEIKRLFELKAKLNRKKTNLLKKLKNNTKRLDQLYAEIEIKKETIKKIENKIAQFDNMQHNSYNYAFNA